MGHTSWAKTFYLLGILRCILVLSQCGIMLSCHPKLILNELNNLKELSTTAASFYVQITGNYLRSIRLELNVDGNKDSNDSNPPVV